MPILPTIAPFALAFLVLLLNKHFVSRPAQPYPPGPKALPAIGNLLDLPPSYQWRTFALWKERWGNFHLFSVDDIATHILRR